jgi:hypothetical protein
MRFWLFVLSFVFPYIIVGIPKPTETLIVLCLPYDSVLPMWKRRRICESKNIQVQSHAYCRWMNNLMSPSAAWSSPFVIRYMHAGQAEVGLLVLLSWYAVFKGTQAWDISRRDFYSNQTCTEWVGDLGTRPKNPKSLCLGPYITFFSRDFCFSAVGDIAKKIFSMSVTALKIVYLNNITDSVTIF